MSTITLETVGRRVYLRGNTYPVRDQLSAGGAKWDPEQKGWYLGVQRRELAERLAAQSGAAQQAAARREREEGISPDADVIRGRCQVPNAEGKLVTYYVLAQGTGSKGPYLKLCFRDGSKVFWARDPSKAQNLKMYRSPTSIASLRAFAEKAKSFGTSECRCFCHMGNGHFGSGGFALFDGCDVCGCEDDG
jgi:hypothetical protein